MTTNNPGNLTIRECESGDLEWLESLYPAAFPEEDLLPLVRGMMNSREAMLPLVAEVDGVAAGHAVFTLGCIEETERKIALLGPVAVDPKHQRSGIGSAIILEGLDRLKRNGIEQVFVLGDPAYYGRFGFLPGAKVKPPHEIPPVWSDAWQYLALANTDVADEGRLSLPDFWMLPELWGE